MKEMIHFDFVVVVYNKKMTSFKKLTVKETIFVLLERSKAQESCFSGIRSSNARVSSQLLKGSNAMKAIPGQKNKSLQQPSLRVIKRSLFFV